MSEETSCVNEISGEGEAEQLNAELSGQRIVVQFSVPEEEFGNVFGKLASLILNDQQKNICDVEEVVDDPSYFLSENGVNMLKKIATSLERSFEYTQQLILIVSQYVSQHKSE